jgi:hypothetical protein
MTTNEQPRESEPVRMTLFILPTRAQEMANSPDGLLACLA